jgi:hypothetical protein
MNIVQRMEMGTGDGEGTFMRILGGSLEIIDRKGRGMRMLTCILYQF